MTNPWHKLRGISGTGPEPVAFGAKVTRAEVLAEEMRREALVGVPDVVAEQAKASGNHVTESCGCVFCDLDLVAMEHNGRLMHYISEIDTIAFDSPRWIECAAPEQLRSQPPQPSGMATEPSTRDWGQESKALTAAQSGPATIRYDEHRDAIDVLYNSGFIRSVYCDGQELPLPGGDVLRIERAEWGLNVRCTRRGAPDWVTAADSLGWHGVLWTGPTESLCPVYDDSGAMIAWAAPPD